MNQQETYELFRLRPVRAARVSEISETTAASPVPPEERVNFHIGNPVQDERLYALFLRMALGNAAQKAGDPDPDETVTPESELLDVLIRKSAPYMPRGGFQRNNPNECVKQFVRWLTSAQVEPLSYDLGETSGIREVLLASGGLIETLRVFFHALDQHLLAPRARVLLWGITLPPHVTGAPRFAFTQLPSDEPAALQTLSAAVTADPPQPAFCVLGSVTREETRRALRQLSLEQPLVVLEANNAANHLSLAREAGMMRRVVRFLTPAIFDERLGTYPTVFVAGNHELVNILEVAHFQLKGTPSATDVELLTHLLGRPPDSPDTVPDLLPESSHPEPVSLLPGRRNVIAEHAERLAGRAGTIAGRALEAVQPLARRISVREESLLKRTGEVLARFVPGHDPLAGLGAAALYEQLLKSGHTAEWQEELTAAFLTQFQKHHPEYSLSHCVAVSGSSRTGLGLLGFHCGIDEVIIPDLSWTYEHCFRSVVPVPLTDAFELDVEALIEEVRSRLAADPLWRNRGAVALNNPHNATGRAFRAHDVRRLLRWLLEHRVIVIDDLAYQNVAPGATLQGPLTLRQLACDMVDRGELAAEHAERLVVMHSVSKTDCLAGSRLAVAEIRHPGLLERFAAVNRTITPNVGALVLSYLFYRNRIEEVNSYWTVRNVIFDERMRALEEAVENLPGVRNRFGISIRRPTGSMYPLMVIDRLPPGLSLEWLSTGLARQGIGLLPLSTFARTERGFEAGRRTFRLTLGGTDTAQRLLTKTRRVLIDLNRMIAEESAKYNRHAFPSSHVPHAEQLDRAALTRRWGDLARQVREESARQVRKSREEGGAQGALGNSFVDGYLGERLEIFRQRMTDMAARAEDILRLTRADGGRPLERLLERELYKDSLSRRQGHFRVRPYDRTVHPTQMYSLRAELLWESALESLLREEEFQHDLPRALAIAMIREYAGLNVAIGSSEEGEELVLDLDALIRAEDYARVHVAGSASTFLSYWGDWDGSNRPSGQGHRLVASVLQANVTRMARIVSALASADPSAPIEEALRGELEKLPARTARFRKLLDQITLLTHQLERRYRGVLPFHVAPGRLRRIGMRLHVARDPLSALWQHNDRLERRMLALREERRRALQYYFQLNKQLRKSLHGLIPHLRANLRSPELALEATLYRDLLQRCVITPRIHQNLVTAQDPFAIDTTVHNIMEINEISGGAGNPGMILGLQISMSTESGALISLDRKVRARREEVLRRNPAAELPGIWSIPLFEDLQAVRDIPRYLEKVWEYALQSRRLDQETSARFGEILPEVFIAGSDLSQQVGQTAGAAMYREAKYAIIRWLADRALVGDVRVKMGSGEPMQRQGGYYAPASGQPAFVASRDSERRLARHVRDSTRTSARYATTPLMGVFAGGDLRTFQSNVSEQVRSLPVAEYAQLLHHVRRSQQFTQREQVRASEPFVETRLQFSARGEQELERLTLGRRDALFDEFARMATENFRAIVYGREEDVVGIHIIAYFIARTTPALRDRPTFRPGQGVAGGGGRQILERIAGTIPLAKHGSLLRAIAHNQAQTAVLGINQLTTGLFRAMDTFARKQFVEGKGVYLLADRVLPHLPVYEILSTLRLYQDVNLGYLATMERAFPPGNSSFATLREDMDAMHRYLGPLRRELLRRHGISVGDFFEGDRFLPDLLPTLRPDLAVLFQGDLFNTDYDVLRGSIAGALDPAWERAMRTLLPLPAIVRSWRARAWELLEKPVLARLSSFVELALALSSLSRSSGEGRAETAALTARRLRGTPGLQQLLSSAQEDSMREFLAAAFEYLSGFSDGALEVPTSVVRALKEIERIVSIEEQALAPREQDLLRFYLLQIARLCGENG